MPDVHIITNEAGDYFAGFEADGVFVPFATVAASRVAQLQERAASLAELAKADDADSVRRHDAAAAGLPYTTKSKRTSKPTTKTEGGES